MDELGALILGKKTEAKPSVISDQLLDSLRRVESGKDPYAINKETKAMGAYQFMPETVQMLHKQGMKFNPFDEQEARGAAKAYLEQLVQRNKGDVNKALAQYGGFVTKDPSKYVQNVTQGAAQPQQTQAPQDELGALILGKQTQPSKPSQQPSQPMQESTAGGGRGSYAGFDPEAKAIAEGQSTRGPRQPEGTALGRMAGSALGQVQEAKRGFGERIAGGIDTLYGVVPAIYGAGVQALARTANTPQEAERIGQQAAATIDKPLGKAFGITGKQTYQQPLGGVTEPIAKEANRMFNQLGMTPEQISEKLGIPAEDIRNMVVIGSVALPQAFKETVPAVKQVSQTIAAPFKEAASELQVQRPTAAADLQAQFAAKQAPAPGSVGAAGVQNNPFSGKFTGEEYGGSETFPQLKLAKIPKDVPIPEQQLRSQLFQEVLPDVKPRMGVVTGNDNLLRNEHALASMAEPSPLGLRMKEQIANEQIGLSKFAEDRVNATGASKSLINDEQRGQRINDVMYGASPDDISPTSITGYLNQAKKEIYNSAFEKSGGNKINTTNVDELFVNPEIQSTFKAAGTTNVLEGAKELIDLAKSTGFKLPDGTLAPAGSVAAYDYVRKVLNSPRIWSRDKASSIREINQAIDRDIAAVADPALYKLGDNIHKLEKSIFESKGIKSLFGEVDQNGVLTSATPLEKIPTKLNNLPKDQWRHVRDTLNDLANGRVRNAPEGLPPVPDELRQYAKSAVAEIDGALAREVYKAGASNVGEWSSKKANNVMNSVVGQKIVETFPPDEIRRFHALNYVGQYTPSLKYEGAALQQRRVGLIEKGLPNIGATVGGSIGGFVGEGNPLAIGGGAYVGREIGQKMQAKKIAKEEGKAVKKMEKEQKKAAELGTKLSDVGK
jgi:hypothetical protein